MKIRKIAAIGILGVLPVLGRTVFATQDRFKLESPNGVAFSEFRGYEGWQDVA
jgi:hypothetical protein